MKKLITIAVLTMAFAVSGLFGAGLSSDATTTSTMLLAPAAAKTTVAWEASHVYAQGELILSGSTVWFALVGGTSGTTPPSGLNDAVDGSVRWRKVLTQKRTGLIICNAGPSEITLSWFSDVQVRKGITLGEGDKILLTAEDSVQSAVYVIIDSGSAVVSIMEW